MLKEKEHEILDDVLPPLEDMTAVLNASKRPKSQLEPVIRIPGENGSKTLLKPNEKKPETYTGNFGFKKGFLNSSKSKSRQNSVPTLRPTQSKVESLRLKELKKPIENGEWISQSFVDKLMTRQDLPQSEHFEIAMQEFATQPEEAFRKYHNNKFIMEGFRKYMEVIGEHMQSIPPS